MFHSKIGTIIRADLTPGAAVPSSFGPSNVTRTAASQSTTLGACDSYSADRAFIHLFRFCVVTGAVLGAAITIVFLENQISLISTLVAGACYGVVGALVGTLTAGFYDAIVRGSLDNRPET